MKKNLSLISSIATILILVMTLIISVSYAWYTNNEDVDASGIGSTASDSISILNQGIYKDVIGEDPFPENNKDNEVSGVLSGDIIYYSVGIELSKTKDPSVIRDINISVVNINGGDFFVAPAIKVINNPNGTLTGNTFTYNDTEYQTYSINDEEYFIVVEDDKEYIYYLYESANGDILTRRPQMIFANPNGSETGTLFEFDGNKYPIYEDSEGKEYFLTYDVSIIDGKENINSIYVNYIYEEVVDDEVTRYNMCDVYTIGIYKVFGVDSDGEYVTLVNNEDSLVLNRITRKSGLDKDVDFFNLYDFTGWNPLEYREIIFTFAIKFDYSEFEGKINTNCVSDKELIFTNVVITDTEREVAD